MGKNLLVGHGDCSRNMEAVKEMLGSVFYYFTEMDHVSQKDVEWYHRLITIVMTTIGFSWGWATQDFNKVIYAIGIAFVFNVIAFVPAWPIWKKHKLTFVPDGDYGKLETDGKDGAPGKKVKGQKSASQNKKSK